MDVWWNLQHWWREGNNKSWKERHSVIYRHCIWLQNQCAITSQIWAMKIIPQKGRKTAKTFVHLPNIIAVSAVVPEDREDSVEHDLANSASISKNDLVTTFSNSKGKSASSTITRGRWSRTNCAALFPPCPSNTCTAKKILFKCQILINRVHIHLFKMTNRCSVSFCSEVNFPIAYIICFTHKFQVRL